MPAGPWKTHLAVFLVFLALLIAAIAAPFFLIEPRH